VLERLSGDLLLYSRLRLGLLDAIAWGVQLGT